MDVPHSRYKRWVGRVCDPDASVTGDLLTVAQLYRHKVVTLGAARVAERTVQTT